VLANRVIQKFNLNSERILNLTAIDVGQVTSTAASKQIVVRTEQDDRIVYEGQPKKRQKLDVDNSFKTINVANEEMKEENPVSANIEEHVTQLPPCWLKMKN